MLSHPIDCKIYPNFRGVKIWGGEGAENVYLNSIKYGIIIYWFLNEDKTLLESSSASASTVPFVEWGFWTLTYSTGHTESWSCMCEEN